MKKYLYIFIILILILITNQFILEETLGGLNTNNLYFTSPADNMDYFFLKNYVAEGDFTYKLDENFPEEIRVSLTPRDATYYEGNLVPKRFIGNLIFLSTPFLIEENMISLINFILPIFILLVLFLIYSRSNNLKIGVSSLIFLIIFSIFLYQISILFINDFIISIFLIIFSIFLITSFINSNKEIYLYLFIFFSGLTVFIRLTNLIYFIPLYIYLIYHKRDKINIKLIIFFIFCLLLFLFPILITNYQNYGNVFTSGYIQASNVADETVNPKGLGAFSLRFDLIFEYLKDYIFSLEVIFLPIFLGLILSFFIKNKNIRNYSAYVFLTFILTFLAFGTNITWGSSNFSVNASILRYLLPWFILSIFFIPFLFFKLIPNRKILFLSLTLFLIIFFIFNLNFLYYGNNGIFDQINNLDDQNRLRNNILNLTEKDSIIVTKIMDKVIFPHRQTVTVTFLSDNKQEIIRGDRYFWDIVPNEERLAYSLKTIIDKEYNLYILNDGHYFNENVLNSELNFYNLALESTDLEEFYEVIIK